MDITLNIKIDIAPKLEAIVSKLLGSAECTVHSAQPEESAEGTVKSEERIEKSDQSAQSTVHSAQPETPAYPTDEEMRVQMDMIISKFAGNGWKESKDARTIAIKKGCTAAFKEIARWLGGEKPTALEDEKRLEFVNRLSEIFIEEGKEGGNPEIIFRPF